MSPRRRYSTGWQRGPARIIACLRDAGSAARVRGSPSSEVTELRLICLFARGVVDEGVRKPLSSQLLMREDSKTSKNAVAAHFFSFYFVSFCFFSFFFFFFFLFFSFYFRFEQFVVSFQGRNSTLAVL